MWTAILRAAWPEHRRLARPDDRGESARWVFVEARRGGGLIGSKTRRRGYFSQQACWWSSSEVCSASECTIGWPTRPVPRRWTARLRTPRCCNASPTIGSDSTLSAPVETAATWRDRSGVPHTGTVPAPQGLEAGSTVQIWIDRSGAAVPEPTSDGDALEMAIDHRGDHRPRGSNCPGGPVGHRAAHHVVLQLRGMGSGMARGRRDLEPRRGQARLRVPRAVTMSASGLVPSTVLAAPQPRWRSAVCYAPRCLGSESGPPGTRVLRGNALPDIPGWARSSARQRLHPGSSIPTVEAAGVRRGPDHDLADRLACLWVPRTRSRHASCTYSCMRPPSRSC